MNVQIVDVYSYVDWPGLFHVFVKNNGKEESSRLDYVMKDRQGETIATAEVPPIAAEGKGSYSIACVQIQLTKAKVEELGGSEFPRSDHLVAREEEGQASNVTTEDIEETWFSVKAKGVGGKLAKLVVKGLGLEITGGRRRVRITRKNREPDSGDEST